MPVRHPNPWAPLHVAFAAVVLCFVASTVVTDWSARAIDEAALGIANVCTPGIEHLESARAELRRLQLLLATRVSDLAAGRAESEGDVGEVRRLVDEHVKAYLSLPVFPTEQGSWIEIGRDLGAVESGTNHLLRLLDAQRVPEAQEAMRSELKPAVDRANVDLRKAVKTHAEHSRALALRIEQTRSESRLVAVALDLLCALFAVAAAAFGLRASRRYAALLEEHTLMLERRADELEMFSGRVAHDILSPLGAVGMAIELGLERSRGEEPITGWLVRGRSSLMRVRTIVTGLLEFAKAGARPRPGAHCQLGAVVADVVQGLGPVAEEENITLSSELSFEGEVACSEGLLTSVLTN